MREGAATTSTLKQATTLSNPGKLLRLRKQYEEAQVANEKAISIRQAGLPDHDPEIANSLNNLGAEAAYRKALASREANPPGEVLASALSNLGTLVRKQNRLPKRWVCFSGPRRSPCRRSGGSFRPWRRFESRPGKLAGGRALVPQSVGCFGNYNRADASADVYDCRKFGSAVLAVGKSDRGGS